MQVRGLESSESEPSKFPVPLQSKLSDLGKRPWFEDISLQSSITNAWSVGRVSRHCRLLSSLQVLADPQLCLSPSSSPRNQPLAYSKQSAPTSPCGCLLDLHRLCARLPRRDLQIILPSAEGRPTSVSHPALPLLAEALLPELSRDAYQDSDTRLLSFPPLQTTHLRKHSSSRSPFFLSLSRIPTLYLLLGSLPPSLPSGSGDPSHLRGEKCAY